MVRVCVMLRVLPSQSSVRSLLVLLLYKHRCTSPKLWGRQRCLMTARSTSRSRASCCCPCGLAPVVTVASSTRWGDATPCYASHHMMLVILQQLCVFKNYVCRQAKVYRVLAICRTYTHTQTVSFFFSHVAIRNSLRSNNNRRVKCYITGLLTAGLDVSDDGFVYRSLAYV